MPGIYETKIRELYINIKTYFFNVPGIDPPGKYINNNCVITQFFKKNKQL